ncbi:endo-1,4-beta-xylanase [Algibacter sp. L4_22]|uniref:endo-1,4-beta-xylanase n=1 Tax=Algibacter sp. L4_22 TaxID=2942477 RepID=UPI00201B75B3|nr:endo-1,4-beta-xylanase [Algibacter sp. L4_22]MCL5129997.1 endo-1,4-beta-xylanase [Algibacter sp. L4_22]
MINKTKQYLILFVLLLTLFNCKNDPIKENSVSLKQAFQNDFFIGAAINKDQIEGTDTLAVNLLKKEFNALTPENEMKWEQIHPKKDSFYFDVADKYVDLGEKMNAHIVGHTLVWHSQLAPWMQEIEDSTVMANQVKHHINTIVTKYKGRINSWDVVNEALNEDGTLRQSIFYNVLGENYIEQAFKAASIADPEAELIYNDYNMWKPAKRAGAIKLVKQIQAKGIRIDGIGMQAHWSLNGPSLEDIENSIIEYSKLGVKVMITELDVTALPNPWDLEGAEVSQNYDELVGDKTMDPYQKALPDSIQVKLANRYEAIFKLFLKHKDKIGRVTFWGVTDKQSWLNNWPIKGRTNYPLLFDRNFSTKKAYDSVIALKQNNDE